MKQMLVVGIILLLLIGWGLFIRKDEPDPVQNQASLPENVVSSDRVTVAGEQSGNVITIASVSLDEPGYVIIRDDLFGEPGVIVGNSRLLPAGDSINVSIPLSVGQTSSSLYYAIVHTDDGDQIFRQKDDPAEVNDTGSMVWVSFIITDAGDVNADISL